MSFNLDLTKTCSQLLFTTIRVETITKEGKRGVGTAFLISKTVKEGEMHYIITNKHVIENADKGLLMFTTKNKDNNPSLGNIYSISINNNFEDIWYKHPNGIDLCITHLSPALKIAKDHSKNLFYRTIPLEIFIDDETAKDLDVYEEICFVGYPNDIYDKKNYLPIFRNGATASHINIDYNECPNFLIDASVFPGSSGSPVFIYNKSSYRKRNTIHMAQRLLFIGVISETLIKNDIGEIKIIQIPTIVSKPIVEIRQMVNLGIVIKSKEVIKLIESYEKQKK